jgi:hypothetical protein
MTLQYRISAFNIRPCDLVNLGNSDQGYREHFLCISMRVQGPELGKNVGRQVCIESIVQASIFTLCLALVNWGVGGTVR